MKIEIKDILSDMIRWRRDLHQIPELGFELDQTVKYVSGILDEIGLPYKYLVKGSAIVAELQGKESGKVVALRADMDALPILEETGLDFASTNGNMHACGHDGHTAMLLGAAKYLNSRRDEIKGTIKFLFQPAEEEGCGSKPMIDEGALENPHVDGIFGFHEGKLSEEGNPGEIMFKKGAFMASADYFDIFIEGRGTHGAEPSRGIDSISIAAELILEIQRMRSREIPNNQTAVISITSVNAGSAYNVIPEKVHLMGTMRAFSEEIRSFMITRLDEICRGLSLSSRAKISIDYKDSCPPTINNEAFTDFAYKVAKNLYGDRVKYMKYGVMGADDMAFYLREVPGSYAFLVNPREIDGQIHPHHHPKFDVDESMFEVGANILANVALEFLKG